MKKKLPFQLYLDDQEQALLERLAQGLGLSKAETVRAALRRWARDMSGEGDPVLQLIGTIDDPALPTDLSTHHDDYAIGPAPARRVAEPRPARKPRK